MSFSYFVRNVNGILAAVRDQNFLWRPHNGTHHVASFQITSDDSRNAVLCANRFIQYFLSPKFAAITATDAQLHIKVSDKFLQDAERHFKMGTLEAQENLAHNFRLMRLTTKGQQEIVEFPHFPAELSDAQLIAIRFFMYTLTKNEQDQLKIFLTNPIRGLYPHKKVAGLEEILEDLHPDRIFPSVARILPIQTDTLNGPVTPSLTNALMPSQSRLPVPQEDQKNKLSIKPA